MSECVLKRMYQVQFRHVMPHYFISRHGTSQIYVISRHKCGVTQSPDMFAALH